MRNVTAVILAAGESKRMGSKISKLLHRLGERCLVELPLRACLEANVGRTIVVVGHQAKIVKKILKDRCEYVYQERRLGTGDALRRAAGLLYNFHGELLVLPGDAPFITPSVLKKLVTHHREKKPVATILTAILQDPGSYGRVIRNGYRSIEKIVESKNATRDQLKIKEINSGIYCFDAQKVVCTLPSLKPDSLSREIYLTDIFEIFHQQGEQVEALPVEDSRVAMGINTPEDLERAYQLLTQKDINK